MWLQDLWDRVWGPPVGWPTRANSLINPGDCVFKTELVLSVWKNFYHNSCTNESREHPFSEWINKGQAFSRCHVAHDSEHRSIVLLTHH